MRLLSSILAGVALLCIARGAACGHVTFISGGTNVGVNDSTNASDGYASIGIPDHHTVLATTPAGGRSEVTLDYSEGGQVVLYLGVLQTRVPALQSYAYASSSVVFSVNASTSYSLTGSVDLAGENLVQMIGFLHDHTLGNHLFYSDQISDETPNEMLVLGEAGGDSWNLLSGSTTGLLIAGHTYEAGFFYSTAGVKGNTYVIDDGASAEGAFQLTIGEPAAVPEPSSIALLGTGVLGLLGYRRRRQIAVESECLK